jgi:hypothetical protein
MPQSLPDGPSCPHCQYTRGFVMLDRPWPIPNNPDGAPSAVCVPFECPRCGDVFVVTVTTGPEGPIMSNVEDLDERPTGDEILSWLDLPSGA